jgi:hypothetical protein
MRDEAADIDAYPCRLVGNKSDPVVGSLIALVREVLPGLVPLNCLRHLDTGDIDIGEVEDVAILQDSA